MALDAVGIESRPLWKPMHKQPVYCAPLNDRGGIINERLSDGVIRQTSASSVAYINGVSEDLFHKGLCLPSGPCVTDEDVERIINAIKSSLL